MRKLMSLLPIVLMVALLFLAACEESKEEAQDPLVGTWVMSNLEQNSTYLAAEDAGTQGLGFAVGDTVGSGGMTWAQFQALGVDATIELRDDGGFSLTGHLPIDNDTLGYAPSIQALEDYGEWTAAEDYSTFMLDGNIYDLGGLLTLDDPDNPTTLTLNYTGIDSNLAKVLPVPNTGFFDVVVHEVSTTTLGFSKQ